MIGTELVQYFHDKHKTMNENQKEILEKMESVDVHITNHAFFHQSEAQTTLEKQLENMRTTLLECIELKKQVEDALNAMLQDLPKKEDSLSRVYQDAAEQSRLEWRATENAKLTAHVAEHQRRLDEYARQYEVKLQAVQVKRKSAAEEMFHAQKDSYLKGRRQSLTPTPDVLQQSVTIDVKPEDADQLESFLKEEVSSPFLVELVEEDGNNNTE